MLPSLDMQGYVATCTEQAQHLLSVRHEYLSVPQRNCNEHCLNLWLPCLPAGGEDQGNPKKGT